MIAPSLLLIALSLQTADTTALPAAVESPYAIRSGALELGGAGRSTRPRCNQCIGAGPSAERRDARAARAPVRQRYADSLRHGHGGVSARRAAEGCAPAARAPLRPDQPVIHEIAVVVRPTRGDPRRPTARADRAGRSGRAGDRRGCRAAACC